MFHDPAYNNSHESSDVSSTEVAIDSVLLMLNDASGSHARTKSHPQFRPRIPDIDERQGPSASFGDYSAGTLGRGCWAEMPL